MTIGKGSGQSEGPDQGRSETLCCQTISPPKRSQTLIKTLQSGMRMSSTKTLTRRFALVDYHQEAQLDLSSYSN